MRAILLGLTLALTGCVTSIKHQSDPSIDLDGYNLVCGGFEHYTGKFSAEISLCENLSANRGEVIVIDVAYHWNL